MGMPLQPYTFSIPTFLKSYESKRSLWSLVPAFVNVDVAIHRPVPTKNSLIEAPGGRHLRRWDLLVAAWVAAGRR